MRLSRTKNVSRLVLESEHLGVSGERHHADAIRKVLTTHGGGRLEYRCQAVIRCDHGNERDPNAVEVLVHGLRVAYIAKAVSGVVASRIGDKSVELKCVIHWNGELNNGIYHVKLFPLF